MAREIIVQRVTSDRSSVGIIGPQGNQGFQGFQGPQGPQGTGYNGITSNSLHTIGTGSKSFALNKIDALTIGTRVRLSNSAAPSNFMEGVITGIASTTITVNVDIIGGSGTVNGWNLSVTGEKGAQGNQGDQGSQGSQGFGYAGITSTSSVLIAVGSKNFTLNKIDALVVGSRVRVANTAAPANYMEGIVTGIATLTITVNVDLIGGSGTLASWNVSIAGDRGAQGFQGNQGVAADWTIAQTTSTPTFTTNAYAILASDNGKLLLLTNGATAGTVNVNTGLGLVAGQRIDMIQTGAGQITIAGTATPNATPGKKFRAQYSSATLLCVGTNSYVLLGDLSA